LAVATLSLMGRGRYGFFSPEVQDRNSKKVTIYTGEAKGLPPQLFEFRFLSARPRLIKSLVGGSVLLLVLGLVIYGFAVANTSSQLFFYLAFCLLSAIGGAVSAFLMIKMPYAKVSISKEGDVRSNREARRQAREVINPELMRRLVRDFRRWLVLGLGCALIAAVSATLCLSEVTDLTLPVAVVESEGQSESISLLTHSAGYWHGFNCRSDMVAIPDKEAKEVQIIAEADLLRSRCQVK
jgi:hypothetical protein